MYSIFMRGRPKKYLTEEARKEARKLQKSRYMFRKPCFRDKCGNNRNYTLAGKTGKHLSIYKKIFLGYNPNFA